MMKIKKRNTIQGQLVLNAVIQLSNHPTADDVYNHVEKLYPNISKATVYRNLNSLVEDGLLLKISVPDAADRFDHTLDEHYHIKCMICKEFMDLNLDYMHDLDEKVSELSKYKILSHDVTFKSICEKCVSKAHNIEK